MRPRAALEGIPPLPVADTPLWRYMPLEKYLHMLVARALYFPAAAQFGDHHEGTRPPANRMHRQREMAVHAAEYGVDLVPGTHRLRIGDGEVDVFAIGDAYARVLRHSVFISCWHANNYESMAMWGLYGPRGALVAVQTDVQTLAACLPDRMPFGSVHYGDPEADPIGEWNILLPFFYKWKSYEHEREVRAIKFVAPPGEQRAPGVTVVDPAAVDVSAFPTGVLVPVDPARLIRRVVIAPGAPGFFRDVVVETTKALGFGFEVVASTQDSRPLY